jgi:ankyrin repeat protein
MAVGLTGCLPAADTVLHSMQGHTAVVRELLTDAGRRSCVKSTNRDGATPLHLAVVAGHADAVQALVNAGARTDARDRVSWLSNRDTAASPGLQQLAVQWH